MMNKSRKTLFWELAHSWWILLTFTFLFNGVAFFYIGSKVKNKRWSIYGAIYSFPFIFMIITAIINPEFGVLPTISICLLTLGAFCSIIHAFRVRKEFLIRLEGQQYLKEDQLRQIESEYGLESNDVHFTRPVPTTVPTRGPLTRQS